MQANSIRSSSNDSSRLPSDDENDDHDDASTGARAPRLREQVTDADNSKAEQHDDDAWNAGSDAASLEALCTQLSDTRFDQPKSWQKCFRTLAHCRPAAARAAHAQPPTKWLGALAQTLVRFLEEFERHVQSGVIDLHVAGSEASVIICNGLGMLSELVDCRQYSAAAQKPLRALAMRLCPKLVAGVIKSGVAMDRDSVAATLALLTWFSRGLKARLLQRDAAVIRDAFRNALEQMPAWAEKPAAHGLDAQLLASCFVHLNTMRQFELLPLEGEGRKVRQARERMQSALKALCCAVPQLPTNSGVTNANICNNLKDSLDAGLLPQQSHGWLMPVVGLLMQRMLQTSREDLLARGGQVLANYGNFLRMLYELDCHEQPAFIGCAIVYRQACAQLIETLRRPDFRLDGDTGQSLANLMSFVKAMARREARESEKRKPQGEDGEQRRALLKAAARQLLMLAQAQDGKRLSPASISGLLSAISYLWASRIGAADSCRALTQELLAAIPDCEHGRWDDAATALCLRAIVEAQRMHPASASTSTSASIQASQLAFLHLLNLLQKHGVTDETHKLYCLQALSLGLQQKWATESTAAWRNGLKRLLDWKDAREPGAKDLEAAIARLAHREEAAPVALETTGEAPAPQPLPGEVGWTPPGGKLATLSSAPALQPEGAAAKRSTTYRAPAETTAGLFEPGNNCAPVVSSSVASVPSTAVRTGDAARAEVHNAPVDPFTRWFELASGERSDAATLQAMKALLKEKPALIHALDGAGNSALYYLIVGGKREAMAWLLEQPDFALGMPLEAFRSRIDAGLFGSRNWTMPGWSRPCSTWTMARWPSISVRRATAPCCSPLAPDASFEAEKPTPAPDRKPPPGKASAAPTTKRSEADLLNDAYAHEDVAAMRRLLRTPAGKDWARKQSDSGHNRLMRAAFEGKARVVEVLLEVDNGRLAEEFSLHGSSALLIAAAAGHVSVAKLLLKLNNGRLARQKSTVDGSNALMMAAVRGQIPCVKVLLAWNGGQLATPGELAKGGENALIFAAEAGHAEVVKVLLGYREGELAEVVTKQGHSAMTLAAEYGHAEVVRVLLGWKQGGLATYPNAQGYTPLLLAAREGHVGTLEVLLKSPNGDVLTKFCQNDRKNALMLAAENGHVAALRTLLAAGIDPRARTDNGETALMLAAKNGHVDVLETLLQAGGAELAHQQLEDGHNALSLAIQHGQIDAYTCLSRFDPTLVASALKDAVREQLGIPLRKERSERTNINSSQDASRSSVYAQDGYSPQLSIFGIALETAIRANNLAEVNKLVNESSFEEMLVHEVERGKSPLQLAVQLRRLDIMRVLLKKTAWNLLVEDSYGPAPFQTAVENRDAAMLKLILDRIPGGQLRFILGEFPERGIGLALQNGDLACFSLMLEHAQRAMRSQQFIWLLRKMARPPRDAAHAAVLAMLDVKQAFVEAKRVNGERKADLKRVRFALEQEIAAMHRVISEANNGVRN